MEVSLTFTQSNLRNDVPVLSSKQQYQYLGLVYKQQAESQIAKYLHKQKVNVILDIATVAKRELYAVTC